MSLATNIQDLATRVATESKSLRTLINGNVADLSSLTTTDKTNLIAAINEIDALIGGAAATTLTDLTDVTLTAPDTGHILRHNGAGQWVNVVGSTYFDPAGTAAAAVAAIVDTAPGTLDTLNELAAALADDPNFAATLTTSLAGKQPLDTDLTAIAALTSAANKVPYSTGAGTWALSDFSSYGRTIANFADAPAARTSIDVYSKAEIGDPATDFVATFNTGLV